MENHQGDKSRLFQANEYFYGKVVVKFSWRWVQLKSNSTHIWYLGLQLYFSHPNWLMYYFPSPTHKQLLCCAMTFAGSTSCAQILAQTNTNLIVLHPKHLV
jgi:hypothetical protein